MFAVLPSGNQIYLHWGCLKNSTSVKRKTFGSKVWLGKIGEIQLKKNPCSPVDEDLNSFDGGIEQNKRFQSFFSKKINIKEN